MAIPGLMTPVGVLRGSLYKSRRTPPRTGAASAPPPPPSPPLPPAVARAQSDPLYRMVPTPGYTGLTDNDETQPANGHEGGDDEGLEDLHMEDQEEQTAPDGCTIIQPVGRG